MNTKEIREKRRNLISESNPEWQHILNLRFEVQRDFKNNQSLSIPTFEKILEWKLRNMRSQVEKIRSFSPDSLIKSITKCYYEIDHPNDEMKTKIKMQVLLSIPWVGIGISSAILTLHEPQFYGIMDLRSWSVLFQKEKKTFSIKGYMVYLRRIRELAKENDCDVQEIDYILWKEYET